MQKSKIISKKGDAQSKLTFDPLNTIFPARFKIQINPIMIPFYERKKKKNKDNSNNKKNVLLPSNSKLLTMESFPFLLEKLQIDNGKRQWQDNEKNHHINTVQLVQLKKKSGQAAKFDVNWQTRDEKLNR